MSSIPGAARSETLARAMMLTCLSTLFLGALMMTACTAPEIALEPPVAEPKPHELVAHGQTRVDEYYWLRERTEPEVIAYLEAENAYTEGIMADAALEREQLYDEIVARIKQDDSTVPVLDDGFYYYRRYEEGRQYPLICRKKGSLEAAEEVILDVNALAEGFEFCSVRGVQVSTDASLVAYAIDTVGRRKYTLKVKSLETGETLEDEIAEVTGNLVWANDNQTLLYTRQDPVTLRSFQVYRHRLGSDPADDVLVFEEADETFKVVVEKTKSNRFLLISSHQTLSTEYRYVDADDPDGEWQVVQPREENHEYYVAHLGDSFIIRTNLDASNFRLMKAPIGSPGTESWTELLPHRNDVFLQRAEIFDEFFVVTEREDGLTSLRIVPWADQDAQHEVELDEPAYVVWVGENPEISSTTLRFIYTSLTTPRSVYDYDMISRERTLMKQVEVLGGFNQGDYVTERLKAGARDGVEVPISVVRRKDTELDGSNPLLLYAYGSYGHSMEPWFKSERLSLLDRGFVFAIAHVRGGQELGRAWYEDGKLLRKKNTFFDLIDCAEHLISAGYTSSDRIFAQGGSAGGLLVGAVANLRPDLFHGIIAAVPWVDVVTTMLDPSIPLTTVEYDEWGDPNEREHYDYMLSYSPYDNVAAADYPHMLVTTGLHDSQVQYWEPAKWVARMRALRTDDNLLLLKTDMGAGHGGPSGRYHRYEETAFDYAFLLKALELER